VIVAPNPKLLLPVLAFAADVPTKGLLLRLPKPVYGLVLTASDSIPEVAATGDAEVDETVHPNLKFGAAPVETERLLLPVMAVKAVDLLLTLRAVGGRLYGVVLAPRRNGRFRNLPPAPNPSPETASLGFPSRAVSIRERREKAEVRNLGNIERERERERAKSRSLLKQKLGKIQRKNKHHGAYVTLNL
jgi:hypothetical protein